MQRGQASAGPPCKSKRQPVLILTNKQLEKSGKLPGTIRSEAQGGSCSSFTETTTISNQDSCTGSQCFDNRQAKPFSMAGDHNRYRLPIGEGEFQISEPGCSTAPLKMREAGLQLKTALICCNPTQHEMYTLKRRVSQSNGQHLRILIASNRARCREKNIRLMKTSPIAQFNPEMRRSFF